MGENLSFHQVITGIKLIGILAHKFLSDLKKTHPLSNFDQNFSGSCKTYQLIISNGAISCFIYCFCILLMVLRKKCQINNSYYPGASHVRIILLWAHLYKKTIFAWSSPFN